MRPLAILLSLLSLLLLRGESDAQSTPPPAHARATLVSESSTIVPNQPFTVAIVFKLDPSWHVYFKHPGDSGLPPSVKWTLPEGLTAGELQFPKPEVLKTPAGTNYVYHDEVALLVTMTPGKDFTIGRAVEIKAALKWLECDADSCVPQRQNASVTLTADERMKKTDTDQFDDWRAKVKAGESFDPAAAK